MMHGEHYKINGWTAAPRWETFHHPPPQSVSSMSTRIRSFAVLSMLVPALAAAQTAPVATAFKANAATMSKNLIAAFALNAVATGAVCAAASAGTSMLNTA